DSPYDQFEALPRPTAIFLHGVDNLSTDDIKGYVNSPLLSKLEWINDSSCNLVCNTPEEATEIAQSLLEDGSQIQTLDHRTLLPAKPFIVENSKDNQPSRVETLSIRMATDEDIKERGARLRSRYYMIHGVDGQELSKERQEARKLHVDRMKRNGGDGRDVFSRLGKKVERAT
ncbi:hypothetical protein BDF20DRAFT_809652, partial [Mycotypha africana]|uniref:uncharacterized protein n=1 Tax=Mycotypha africana TaxID=64632 RepID=UPI002301BDCB